MGNTKDDQQTSSVKPAPQKKPNGFKISPEPVTGADAPEPFVETAPPPPPPPFTPAPPPARPAFEDLGDLPASYLEDRLYLVARDPRWLFCYWDFAWMKVPKAAFRFGVPMFFLKILRANGDEETVVEVKPEARNWYLPVSAPGTEYRAEMGYYDTDGAWVAAVASNPAHTPAEALAEESLPAEFVKMPAGLSFEEMIGLVNERMAEGESLLQAVARIAGDGRAIAFAAGQTPSWTDEQRSLLAALLGHSVIDRMGLGSGEIDALLRKQLLDTLHSESASGLGPLWGRVLEQVSGPSSLFSGITSWASSAESSWGPQAAVTRGFFMHVNAEIIFYGGTDPDATVWIDGAEVKLQPDGTFRYHFRLPDGDWAIPIVARSPDGVEERSATLTFARGTARRGEVGHTAQPAGLPAQPMGRK